MPSRMWALVYAAVGAILVYVAYLAERRRRAVDEANAALKEAQRAAVQTRQIIELAPDAFFQANLEARFTDVNREGCRLLGYSRDEILSLRIFDLIAPEDAARL